MQLILSVLVLIVIMYAAVGVMAPWLFVPWIVLSALIALLLGSKRRISLPVAAFIAYTVVAGAFLA